MTNVFDFTAVDIKGNESSLERYRGSVLLIVNVASRCGFTPQYRELETLYRAKCARGLVILGFPCNQFGSQEPLDEAAIADFCTNTFQVSFPMFSKVEVNGEHAHRLFSHLKQAAPGILGSQSIKWNFTKFLVDRRGNVRSRHAPTEAPSSLEGAIETLLAESA